MKNIIRSSYLKIGAVAVAMSFGISAYAEPPREELVHAFHLIEKANADYDGHRVKAKDEVEAAGRDLGLDLKGDIAVGERQWKSDDQLREARRLLADARDKMEAKDHDRIASRIEKAIKELDLALKTR